MAYLYDPSSPSNEECAWLCLPCSTCKTGRRPLETWQSHRSMAALSRCRPWLWPQGPTASSSRPELLTRCLHLWVHFSSSCSLGTFDGLLSFGKVWFGRLSKSKCEIESLCLSTQQKARLILLWYKLWVLFHFQQETKVFHYKALLISSQNSKYQ